MKLYRDNRFKPSHQNQTQLFPPNVNDLLPQDHPARIVNQVIEQIDLSALIKEYPGGGASAYHPRMLLKIIVFAYISNIFSSRKIAQACKEQVPFMWLAGMETPDHNTINRFRSERLKNVLKEVFTQVALLLAQQGLLSLDQSIFIDGTKLEANANRYTFVWGKAIKTHKEKMQKQLDELWNYAQQIAKEELNTSPPPEIAKLDTEELAKTIETINEALKAKPVEKKIKQQLNRAKKEWPSRIARYNKQEEILNGRGSYSKTDHDATFMRTKDDHLGNHQLKPCYNWQIATSGQYIVQYSIHQSSSDVTTLPQQISDYESTYGLLPAHVIADAGYSSEENYALLDQKKIDAYIKDLLYDCEKKKSWQNKHPFHASTLHYDPQKDVYYCPMGQPMLFRGEVSEQRSSGYKTVQRRYEATNCAECPLRGPCHKSQGNRQICVNPSLNTYRAQVRSRLGNEEGQELYKRRSTEVESVFGNVKSNMSCRRLLLRGKEKVETEVGLISMAHNIKKLALHVSREKKKPDRIAA